jgi:hypothetical protein
MNRNLGKSGSYFKCKCQADFVEEESYTLLFDTIHSMPVNSKFVETEKEWPFSSSADYTHGRGNNLCDFALAKSVVGANRYVPNPEGFSIYISKKTVRKVIGALRGRDFIDDHLELHKAK